MKKLALALAGILCAITLVACGGGSSTAGNIIGEAIGSLVSDGGKGEIGKAYHTQWFAFRVDSVERVSEYAGYATGEGNELLDVAVTERNIFGEAITMGTFDFYLDSDTFLEYVWPMDPMDETMMPDSFVLADKEEVTYHMIYEIPAGLTDLILYYTEFNEDGEEGDTFAITIPN